MRLFNTLIFLGLVFGSHSATVSSDKKCSNVQGEQVVDSSDGYSDCQTWCPTAYEDKGEVQGSCKSYWTGYYCQCMYKADNKSWSPIDTEKVCEFTQIPLVDDSSDGLKTCDEWCKAVHRTNTGKCNAALSGFYCYCY